MPSPAKKRKLNGGSKASASPVKGLEYFFNKQKQSTSEQPPRECTQVVQQSGPLTDEELARKLQEEWDREVADERQNGDSAESGSQDIESETTEPLNGLLQQEDVLSNQAVEQSSTPAPVPKEPGDGVKKTLTLQSASISEDSINTTVPLDEPPLTFDPSKYIGQLQQSWSTEGGDASYALLTRCFVLVSSTTSRIKTVDTLVNCLRLLIEGDPSSLLPAVSHTYAVAKT